MTFSVVVPLAVFGPMIAFCRCHCIVGYFHCISVLVVVMIAAAITVFVTFAVTSIMLVIASAAMVVR